MNVPRKNSEYILFKPTSDYMLLPEEMVKNAGGKQLVSVYDKSNIFSSLHNIYGIQDKYIVMSKNWDFIALIDKKNIINKFVDTKGKIIDEKYINERLIKVYKIGNKYAYRSNFKCSAENILKPMMIKRITMGFDDIEIDTDINGRHHIIINKQIEMSYNRMESEYDMRYMKGKNRKKLDIIKNMEGDYIPDINIKRVFNISDSLDDEIIYNNLLIILKNFYDNSILKYYHLSHNMNDFDIVPEQDSATGKIRRLVVTDNRYSRDAYIEVNSAKGEASFYIKDRVNEKFKSLDGFISCLRLSLGLIDIHEINFIRSSFLSDSDSIILEEYQGKGYERINDTIAKIAENKYKDIDIIDFVKTVRLYRIISENKIYKPIYLFRGDTSTSKRKRKFISTSFSIQTAAEFAKKKEDIKVIKCENFTELLPLFITSSEKYHESEAIINAKYTIKKSKNNKAFYELDKLEDLKYSIDDEITDIAYAIENDSAIGCMFYIHSINGNRITLKALYNKEIEVSIQKEGENIDVRFDDKLRSIRGFETNDVIRLMYMIIKYFNDRRRFIYDNNYYNGILKRAVMGFRCLANSYGISVDNILYKGNINFTGNGAWIINLQDNLRVLAYMDHIGKISMRVVTAKDGKIDRDMVVNFELSEMQPEINRLVKKIATENTLNYDIAIKNMLRYIEEEHEYKYNKSKREHIIDNRIVLKTDKSKIYCNGKTIDIVKYHFWDNVKTLKNMITE